MNNEVTLIATMSSRPGGGQFVAAQWLIDKLEEEGWQVKPLQQDCASIEATTTTEHILELTS